MTDQLKYKNLIRQIKNSFVINVFDNSGMYIFVLAVNKDEDKNIIQMIKFEEGIGISAGVYDTYNDCFYVRCENYILLGKVPISITCHVEDNKNWLHKVPLSKKILNKLIDKDQKKMFKKFVMSYSEDNYSFEFLQLYNSKYK